MRKSNWIVAQNEPVFFVAFQDNLRVILLTSGDRNEGENQRLIPAQIIVHYCANVIFFFRKDGILYKAYLVEWSACSLLI